MIFELWIRDQLCYVNHFTSDEIYEEIIVYGDESTYMVNETGRGMAGYKEYVSSIGYRIEDITSAEWIVHKIERL